MSTTIPGLPHLTATNIFCIGRNYVEHARELNNNPPDCPLVFLKPTSSIISDGDTIQIPEQSNNVHHEVELVTAIGEGGKNISEKRALQHVDGYAIGIDVTARDIQQEAKEAGHPWSIAKGFDTFAPISSFVRANKITNPQNIDLTLSVNGEIRQSDNTELMIVSITKLISYLSSMFTLQPGDLIFTGTPKGVSAIQPGDDIQATLGDNLVQLNVTVSGS
ncbi:5-carboxymethyl-2-hydroxymuconate isomerase [Fodinibius salinus]|uniref:5-carboxymethyl-2-hydroxymuconate isomerase n=1 Tax=Fodinibius salinus TaxID=860790 RepID=A0A5D3YP19_9BACT|nr:fumarylacetoacetate hydrolase family protein [Fodinibius salinus]TYP94773.1 5-carboxymethyl-2-hydroxymuconate isomerase [Fodinibius salinus]